MKNLETIIEKVFANNELEPSQYVNIQDYDDDLEGLKEAILETSIIADKDITYYSNAIKYLLDNDDSLKKSLEIAQEYGYDLEGLDSEILATLLYQKNLLEEFETLWDEVESLWDEVESLWDENI